MPSFLVLTLESQLASFGDLAGYERRGTGTWPAKSALIGLIGASLGIRRHECDELDKLRALSFTVAMYDSGMVIRDFHTAQAVHQKVKRPATRAIALRQGLKAGALNTVLTKRDYRCGVSYGVAVWGDSLNLKKLLVALENPVFTLYLGRKACPLSTPVGAKLVDADSPLKALDNVTLPPWRSTQDDKKPAAIIYASDPHPALNADFVESRYDVPVDREQWHFQTRDVHMIRGGGGG